MAAARVRLDSCCAISSRRSSRTTVSAKLVVQYLFACVVSTALGARLPARSVRRSCLKRARASVALEINDSELYASLRKAVDAVPDPELRRELKLDPWKSLQERYPVNNSFMDAMAEIQEQKRIRQRNAVAITLLGCVICVLAYLFLHQPDVLRV